MFYTIEEALEKNEGMLEKEEPQAWNQREYRTLLLIKDHFDQKRIKSRFGDWYTKHLGKI